MDDPAVLCGHVCWFRFPRIAVNHEKIIREKLEERAALARQNQQKHPAKATNSQVSWIIIGFEFTFLILISRITTRKKKEVRLQREVNLDLSQGLRRAETETGRGIETGEDPRPGPDPDLGSERRKAKKRRETDLVTGLGRGTAGIAPETGTDISGTGERTGIDVIEIRTTLMN